MVSARSIFPSLRAKRGNRSEAELGAANPAVEAHGNDSWTTTSASPPRNDGKILQRFLALSSALLLAACDLAPDFALPHKDIPKEWKEVTASDGLPIEDGAWKKVDEASFVQFGQGEWWKVFADTRLDALIDAGMKQSPTLEAAREKLIQARQQADVAEANLYPDITGNAGVNRQRQSPANPNIPPGVSQKPYTLYRANVGIDYGLDFFGRARNNLEAALMRAESQKALLNGIRLTLQADIAENYFALLSLSEEHALLTRALALRNETLKLTRTRYELGEVSDLDVARAETELATTESDMLAVREQRAVTEHLLATLTGKAPVDFAMPECIIKQGSPDSCDLLSPPPQIPAGLPSSLLERRPDIASAARELAARNAQIGVSRAAFFPSIDLTANFGYESSSLGSLFDWSSRTWLLGPASGTFVSLPIFTGGRNTANLLLSKSSYREQVANYRGTVLTAFREVEDALIAVRTARERGLSQTKALGASSRAYRIAKLQYDNGYTDYLTLIDSERSLIAAARGEVQSRGMQYTSTVTFIRALGGGWGDVLKTKPKEKTKKPAKEKPAPVAAPEQLAPAIESPRALPERLPRPWDDKKDGKMQAPATAPVAAPQPKIQPVPFRKRNPSKPIPGLEDAPKPSNAPPAGEPLVMEDLDTENALMPFKKQGER